MIAHCPDHLLGIALILWAFVVNVNRNLSHNIYFVSDLVLHTPALRALTAAQLCKRPANLLLATFE